MSPLPARSWASARTRQVQPGLGRARQVWVEVIERRREWARQTGSDSFEGHPAHDLDRWLGELDDARVVIEDAVRGNNEVDPRAAAVDVMAVCSAWIDVMGDVPPPASG